MMLGLRTPLLIAGMLSFSGPGSAKAVMKVRYAGEDSLPEALRLEGASVVPNASALSEGGTTIVCDSRESGSEWNEFLQTDPRRLRLEEGRGYLLSFRWRLLEGKAAQLYYLARSYRDRGRGGLADMLFWIDDRSEKTEGRVEREFLLEGRDDYYFIVGIRGPGLVAIDELIVLETGSANGPDEVVPIATGFPCPYAERLAWVKRVQEEDGVIERLNHMLVVCSQERMRDPKLIAKVIREVSPDIMHCNNFGPIGAEWGIRTGVQGMEYDAYYRVEGPQYWEDRMEYFKGRGFGETRDGRTPQNTVWGEGGYMCCHNGDRWHEAQKMSMVNRLDKYEDIRQDNLTWANFLTGGCYCPACESQFRNHLRERYLEEHLAQWGVEDLEQFSVRNYFNELEKRLRALDGYVGSNTLTEPIVREYIKFQNIAHLDTLGDSVEAIKRKGREMNRGAGFWGNQVGLDIFPTGMSVSPWCDVIQVENQGAEHILALARGAGGGRKAAWVGSGYGTPTHSDWSTAPESFLRDRFGLCLTMGGLHDVYLWGQPPEKVGLEAADNLDCSKTYPFLCRYARFLRENRSLFTETRRDTRLAVVWSFPSSMWRPFLDLNMDGHHRRVHFCELSTWLWEHHLPFDVIVFGHPEIWPDEEHLARLKNYDVAILPNIDCLSDAQIEALQKFSGRGGRILYTNDLGTRDENFNTRHDSEVAELGAERLKHGTSAVELLRECVPFRTDAAPEDRVTLFRSPGDEHLIVHVWRPLRAVESGKAEQISVEIYLPKEYRSVRDVVRYTFDEKGQKLVWLAPSPNRVCFTVPVSGHYCVVAVGEAEKWQARNRELQEWVERDREQVREYASQYLSGVRNVGD